MRARRRVQAKAESNGGHQRANNLPTYDFLRKEDAEKADVSLRPSTEWWHCVFAISLASMLASIVTLWAPYPIGARTSSESVALTPFSNGCIGLHSCICPRATICADDVLSMIFLTIARATAFFNYPLYMMLFLSKANNLNNFLQTTALKCWVNFSDFHHVHSLFGIIVGLESTSHTFFHVLRWARRGNDIQVSDHFRQRYNYLISRFITYLMTHTASKAALDEYNRHHRCGCHHSHSICCLTHGSALSQTPHLL